MPFTFSHPAAILPINHFFKRRLSTTGLVAGSLVPDFEYFVRIYHQSFYSHTWSGLFYLDLPAGLLLCFLYQCLLRNPFYASAPLFLKQRMARFQPFHWKQQFAENWQMVLLSVLLGAFTHLLWDKLTHHSVPFVQSAVGTNHFVTGDDWLMTYFFFWDVSSLTGLFFVIYSIWTLPTDKTITASKSGRLYWLSLSCSALVFFLIQFSLINREIVDNVAIALVNAVLLGLLFTSALFTFRKQPNKLALAEKK